LFTLNGLDKGYLCENGFIIHTAVTNDSSFLNTKGLRKLKEAKNECKLSQYINEFGGSRFFSPVARLFKH
jgi:hypothetical protein